MKIAIDIDGVVRDWVGKVQEVYKRVYPDHWTKEVTEWSMSPFFEIGKGINAFIWDGKYTREIYETADAYDGAVEDVGRLIKAGHEVFFLTSQPNQEAERCTDLWCSLMFPGIKVVHASSPENKGMTEAEIYLDDSMVVLNALEKTRPASSKVCIARPWNAEYVGKRMTLRQFSEKIWSEF